MCKQRHVQTGAVGSRLAPTTLGSNLAVGDGGKCILFYKYLRPYALLLRRLLVPALAHLRVALVRRGAALPAGRAVPPDALLRARERHRAHRRSGDLPHRVPRSLTELFSFCRALVKRAFQSVFLHLEPSSSSC